MLQTSACLLRLLALLQTPRDWSAAELAGRLEVTERTVHGYGGTDVLFMHKGYLAA
jgi:hypothetical protein